MFWTEEEDGVREGAEGLGGGGQDPLPGGQEIRLPVVINGVAAGGGLEALGASHTRSANISTSIEGDLFIGSFESKM